MAGIFTDVWRIVKPVPQKQNYEGTTDFRMSNFSWMQKVLKGAASRFSKYTQYKNMDSDVFVSRALDTIAEEMSPISVKTDLPFEIVYQNELDQEVPEAIVMTVRAALRHWSDIQELDDKIFDISRCVIKYGDCFFRKTSDFKKWEFIEPRDIIGVLLDKKDAGKVQLYQLKKDDGPESGAFGSVVNVPRDGIVHFSLSSDMGELGPFGESVLASVIKSYRHLTMLQDAVIIYRIVRAPERRVFMIDTGNMPPQRSRAYLESIKTEMRQKRIPSAVGGTEAIDSMYDPISMTQDYFFAQSADGRGSKVDTLPGGENLGKIDDLNYFQNTFLQGLRIPSSYMRGSDDGGLQIQDGKVGVAYIEEQRFVAYVRRLQQKISSTFDYHFKAYLKSAGINIDPSLFKIKLNDPQNFDIYKKAEVDEKLISNFSNLKELPFISKRYLLMQYLGWSQDDLQTNEAMLKQELSIPEGGIGGRMTELRMLYDSKWFEAKPEIKVAPEWEDYTGLTGGKEKEEPKDDEDPPPEGEESASGSTETPSDDEPSDKGEEASEKPTGDAEPKTADEEEPKSLDDLAGEIGKAS